MDGSTVTDRRIDGSSGLIGGKSLAMTRTETHDSWVTAAGWVRPTTFVRTLVLSLPWLLRWARLVMCNFRGRGQRVQATQSNKREKTFTSRAKKGGKMLQDAKEKVLSLGPGLLPHANTVKQQPVNVGGLKKSSTVFRQPLAQTG